MSKLCVCLVVLCFVYAQARPAAEEAKILRAEQDVRPDGYDFDFETSNGIRRSESGKFQETGKEEGILTVNGESNFELDGGIPFQITFVADENGYRPKYVIGLGKKVK